MSYEDPVNQGVMALDEYRNAFYERALKQFVNSDSVVLDAGAGIGTLGLMAAKLGARRVYLIEPVTQREAILQLIDENQLTDKVVLLPERIETASLPESVDVITSVFTGNFLLEEDLLPSLFLARDRWLKPGGFLLPGQGSMIVVPVEIETYYEKQICSWRRRPAGVVHEGMHRYAVNTLYYAHFNKIAHDMLAEPKQLTTLDFYTASEAACDAKIEIDVTKSGDCHGFLCWFDISFENDWLSTGPRVPATHWSQVYLPIDPVLSVNEGDRLKFQLKRPEFGDWHWQLEIRGQCHRHSTFLSRPISPHHLAVRSKDHRPVLNEEGTLMKALLQLMDGDHTNGEIAGLLFQKFSARFGSIDEAVRFVSSKVADMGTGKLDT